MSSPPESARSVLPPDTYGLIGFDQHDELRIITVHERFVGTESVEFSREQVFELSGDQSWAIDTLAAVLRTNKRYWPGISPIICRLDDNGRFAFVEERFLTAEGMDHYGDLLKAYGITLTPKHPA